MDFSSKRLAETRKAVSGASRPSAAQPGVNCGEASKVSNKKNRAPGWFICGIEIDPGSNGPQIPYSPNPDRPAVLWPLECPRFPEPRRDGCHGFFPQDARTPIMSS